MNRVGYELLIFGAAWLFYVYAGYPICLWVLGFFSHPGQRINDNYFPSVSVLIAARNEQRDIGWKVRQTLSWNYPNERLEVLVASDASSDDTDGVLKGISDPRLSFIRLPKQGGKVQALNALVRMAKGELLFFTDANSSIGPEALRHVASHFADPRVGCVTGADRTAQSEHGHQGHDHAIALGESTYWNYELLIDDLESRLGSVLVCFGAIHCLRRRLYVDCDPDLANDLEIPIRIGGAGYLVTFEPKAVSLEKATPSPLEEFRRRRRICGQGALGLYRLRGQLHGLRAWQFLSRKFLRWLAALPLLAVLLGSALIATGSVFGRFLLISQLLCYAAAAFGLLAAARHRNVHAFIAVPFYFLLVNVAALVGVLDACRGRRYSVWSVASKTRGSEPAASPVLEQVQSCDGQAAHRFRSPLDSRRGELHGDF